MNCSHHKFSPMLASRMIVSLLQVLPSRRKMALCRWVDGCRERAGTGCVKCSAECVSIFQLHICWESSGARELLASSLYLILSSPSSQSAMVLGVSLGCSIICAVARSAAISAMYVVSAKW